MGKETDRKACLSCNGEFPGDLATCPTDGTALTSLTSADLTGTVLDDRYEILDVIGGGGMGMVYRAKQRFINRTVAVKVLHKGSISTVDILKRFQLEAQAASLLSNPHIVTVFDSNVSRDGEPYIVMDYLEGPSLESILDTQGALTVSRALPIFIQICDALGKAHGKGIVHRDIKPSNIVLVNEDGEADFVKIVDFGIAKILRESEAAGGNLTRTGEIFGSPLYMSPEQWRGGNLDARADIYSLGAVMYRTLSGAPIFQYTDILQLAYKHAQELPQPFASLGVSVPMELEAIILKALSKEPEDRFQRMQEMRQALMELQTNIGQALTTASGAAPETSSLGQTGSATPGAASVSSETQAWLRELTPGNIDADQTRTTPSLSGADEKTYITNPVEKPANNERLAAEAAGLSIPKGRPKTRTIAAAVVTAVVVGGASFYAGTLGKLGGQKTNLRGDTAGSTNILPLTPPPLTRTTAPTSNSAPTATQVLTPTSPARIQAPAVTSEPKPIVGEPERANQHSHSVYTQRTHTHSAATHKSKPAGIKSAIKKIFRKL